MKPCPFCGSAARRYTYPSGIRCQLRCTNKACKARGPYVDVPYPYVPWAVEHAAADMAERRALQSAAVAKALEAVRSAADRAWNERAQ